MIPSIIERILKHTERRRVRGRSGSPHLRRQCSFLPAAALNHFYSLTHTDQVSAECCETKWCQAPYGLPKTPEKKEWPYLQLSPVTLNHVAIIHRISQWDAITSNSITAITEPQSAKWSNRNPLLSQRSATSACNDPCRAFLISLWTRLRSSLDIIT